MGGITNSYAYQLLTESGSPVGEWGPDVVSIRSILDHSGTVIIDDDGEPRATLLLEGHDERVLGGIRTTTRTLMGSGTGTTTVITSSGTVVHRHTREISLTIPAGAAYPTGTVSVSSTVDGDDLATTAVTTYDGSPVLTMTISIGAETTQVCTIDLRVSGPPSCS